MDYVAACSLEDAQWFIRLQIYSHYGMDFSLELRRHYFLNLGNAAASARILRKLKRKTIYIYRKHVPILSDFIVN